MKTNKFLSKTILSSALLAITGGAQAAAFQLAEVSSSGLGRAYAGEAAIADNASVVATNPALMTLFKTRQFSAGGVYVDSKIRINGTVSLNNTPQTAKDADNNNVVPGSFVPNLYFVSPINDKFAIGAGMNVNFGLKSEYSDDYSGGVFGGKTELTAMNFNFSGAYRVIQGLSFGAGINAVYAKAELKRNAGILSTSSSQVLVHLEDKNTWAFGWNAGLVYEFNDRNRIGVAYHSKLDLKFSDRNAIGGASAQQGPGSLTLHLPSYLEISGYHQFTDAFAMHYSYKYTKWGRLQRLTGTFDSGNEAFNKDLNYRSNSRIALGATYLVNDVLTLRAGIAYDEAAATAENAIASIPDTDRTWYSVGATYNVTPNLSVDFGFAHLRGKKITFTEQKQVAQHVTVIGNYSSRASANLYGLNVNYSF